jgi:hypothetical protein
MKPCGASPHLYVARAHLAEFLNLTDCYRAMATDTAWHVVQQRQGRVRETMQMAGVAINDEAELEREADTMGTRAANTTTVLGPDC